MKEIICKKCGSKAEKNNGTDLFLCRTCYYKKINIDLKNLWISEILEYKPYDIEEFLPDPPLNLLRAALKDYIVDDSIRANINDYLNSHSDNSYSSLDLHAIAQTEKEILLESLFEPHIRSCEKCGMQYKADSIWKYTICPKCAENKKEEWERLLVSELDYDEEYMGLIPTPPFPVDKYIIDEVKPKNRMDQEAASRIQANADKNDTNEDFKSRAQSAAKRNERLDEEKNN